MATDTMNDTGTTLAQRIEERGGLGLPPAALKIFNTLEQRRETLSRETKYSPAYIREQLAELERQADEGLRLAEIAERDAAIEALEKQRGQILGEIKGQARARGLSEGPDDQRERLGRQTREAIDINTAVVAASISGDVQELTDMLDELMLSEHDARIRTVAPVIVSRLGALADHSGRAKVEGASSSWMAARTRLQAWRKDHPSALARLRALDEQIRSASTGTAAAYTRARQAFKFGKHATGMQI